MAILWPNGLTTPPPFSIEGHFGWRNANLSYASRYHRGQDFYGFSTVHAIADGEVVRVGRYAGWEGGGYMVWTQHDGFFSRSLHLADGSALVKVGQRVTAGQPIATMGATNGGGYGMAVHLHLEITPGQWHAGNYGQVDPKAWLYEHVTGTATTGAGGSAVAPVIESEEDDMRLIRITNGSRKGRHYAIAPEYIKQVTSSESVKAVEDAFGITEKPVSEWTFGRILGTYGIPSDVVDSRGYIRNDLEGKGHVSGGTWSRAQRAERYGYLAQKE